MAEELNETEAEEGSAEDDVEDSISHEDDDILASAREFITSCKSANGENRRLSLEDLEFLKGGLNQWDSIDVAQRKLDGRPCLTINKIPTFLHQLTNALRQNRSTIKVHPVSTGADVDTAKVRQGIIRHAEYDSNAPVAYSTAACSAAAIGYGYFRIITEYCTPDSFDQEVKFCRIRNPFVVHFDPMSVEPDGSDQTRCLIESRMLRSDFSRQWPDAKANDKTLSLGTDDIALNWMLEDEVVIGEFYRIEMVPTELYQMQDGTTLWADEVPEESKTLIEPLIVARRMSAKRSVWLYKLTGTDVLEKTEVKSFWIPVLPVYGDEIDINGVITRSGMIRNAKDPCRLYNYFLSSATEEIALRPKTPYIGAFGQFEGFEKDWAQANRRSFPYLQYNPVTVDGNIAPAPQRQPMADIPSGFMQLAMISNDNIKATTGLFDSSLGARGNATSGKQELAQQQQGDTANFHYLDGLQTSIRHAGRIFNYMIPYYYDTKRVVKIMGIDETISSVTINEPNPEIGAIEAVLNDMTGGEYTVTVDAGPAYQTMRQESAEMFANLAHNNTELMSVAGDLIIGEMDVPGADKIAARIKRSLPPNLTEDNEGDMSKRTIEDKLMQMQQMKQQLDQQSQMMNEQGMALEEQQKKAEQATLKAKEASATLSNEQARMDADRAIMQADYARIKAELALAKAQDPTDTGDQAHMVDMAKADAEGEYMVWKAKLDAETELKKQAMSDETKLKIAEIHASTTISQHSIQQETALATAAMRPEPPKTTKSK